MNINFRFHISHGGKHGFVLNLELNPLNWAVSYDRAGALYMLQFGPFWGDFYTQKALLASYKDDVSED